MPLMNLAVIAIILGLAYFWAGQGLFSSLIHFVCVFIAGAVAFAVWEPLVYGLLIGMRDDVAWTLGLLAPFTATLAVLRVATNKLVASNLDFDDTTNFVGGGFFGLLSGVLTAGLIVISIGFLRLPPDFLGYKPADWDNTGSVDARNGSNLWAPADMITARVYEQLSLGTLGSASPLAQRLPDVHIQAGLLRTTYEGQSRTTLKPEDVSVVSRYTVSAASPAELLTDTFIVSADGSPVAQPVTLPDGSTPPAGSRIEGYAVKFGPGAKEKKGQTVIGPGQIRLMVTTADGSAMSLGPIAFITRASGASLQVNRYRFDGPQVYAASVGGAAESTMAFEFVVPPNATATDLLIKNVRVPVDRVPPPRELGSISERDDLVRSGDIIGEKAESVAGTEVITGDTGPVTLSPDPGGFPGQGVREIRPTRALGITFNKQNRGGLDVNDENMITNGRATLDKRRMGDVNVPNVLRVDQFSEPQGTVMVQVDVGPQSRASLLGRSLDAAERVLPPILTDTLGQQYQAVGYIYEDQSTYEIRFTPGEPIRGLAELPTLSRSRADQKLTLLFTPSAGVQIVTFGLGGSVKVTLSPPLQLRNAN